MSKPTSAPNRRWFRWSLRELFLAITAVACALGWANERWNHPHELTVRQAITWLDDEQERVQVDCRDEETSSGTFRVMHWLVRTREQLPD